MQRIFLAVVPWLSQAAAAGVRPTTRWDGTAWPDDSVSGDLEPQLSAIYLLVQLKADWVELSSTLGFPTWQSYHAPCFYVPVRS
eukprot:7852276-Pyramimonas_sp.AAC.1